MHADQERIRVNRSEGPCVCGDCGSPGYPGMNNMCSMCYGSRCKFRPDGQPFHRTKKGIDGSSYTIPYNMCDDFPGMREHLMLASMCGSSPSGCSDDVDIVDQLVMEEGFGSDYGNVMGKPATTRASVRRFNTPTQVQHLRGTGSNDRYIIDQLKKKYLKLSGTQRNTCCIQGCSCVLGGNNWATAHVKINDGRKNGGTFEWWLIPTCKLHNNDHGGVQIATANTVFVKVSAVRDL